MLQSSGQSVDVTVDSGQSVGVTVTVEWTEC